MDTVGNDTKKFNMIDIPRSECCGASVLAGTEIHDGIGMCADCKEWSAFEVEEEEETKKNEPII